MVVKAKEGLEGLDKELAAAPLLRGIRPAAVRSLAALGSLRHYRRGTYLFYQGDSSESVFFLWRGRIEISSFSVTGHRQLLTTLASPQFFGELGVLGSGKRTSTAEALEECTVWVISGDRFMQFLAGHFEATRELLR